MKQILTPTLVQQATVRINCGDQEGTAFYVKSNRLLTAFHVIADNVDEGKPIEIVAGARRITCTIHNYDLDLDICLLACEEASENFLPLEASPTKVKEDCQLFGYPYQNNASSLSLSGKIAQVIIGEISDFIVGELNIAKQYDYSGLSGSPLVTGGHVSGVVLRQSDDRITCISVKKLQGFLEQNVVAVKEADVFSNIPQEFSEDVKTSTPNYAVIAAINDAIEREGSYILTYGAPGSGKSTLMATFKPSKDEVVLCGHYFIKVPNSTLPVSTRISPPFFLETMEQLLSTTLTGELLPKEEMTWEKRVIRLTGMLNELGRYYEQQDKTGIIIIDGLDDVTNTETFLGILPTTLHEHVKIILSCTSEAILPGAIRSVIRQEQKVEVTPLDLGQCEAFIMDQVDEPRLPVSVGAADSTKVRGTSPLPAVSS